MLRVEVRQARGLLWPAAAAATAAREQGGGQDAGGKADRAEIGLTEAALRARVRVGCKEGATPPVTVTSESPPPLCCLACCIPPLASYPSHGRMSGPPGAVCGRGGGAAWAESCATPYYRQVRWSRAGVADCRWDHTMVFEMPTAQEPVLLAPTCTLLLFVTWNASAPPPLHA